MTMPLDFDCGVATPEFFDAEKNSAMHVLNVKIVGEANRDRVLKFVCRRIRHFQRHLPKNCHQHLRFDFRGQLVSEKTLAMIKSNIENESIKRGVSSTVDFLT